MRILADLKDVQQWLPEDKLEVTDPDTEDFQIEARRIIIGQLSGVFTPVTLFGWSAPETTPDVIRGIAGRIIAAYVYRKAYSEDDTAIPAYAQALYDEAIMLIMEIKAGTLIVVDDTDNPIESTAVMSASDFWPNDTTAGPYFTMDQIV